MKWFMKAPTEPGYYWLYGNTSFGMMGVDYTEQADPEIEIHFVEIVQLSNAVVGVVKGHFMELTKFNKDKQLPGYLGVWAKATPPRPPQALVEKVFSLYL